MILQVIFLIQMYTPCSENEDAKIINVSNVREGKKECTKNIQLFFFCYKGTCKCISHRLTALKAKKDHE